MSTPFTVDLGGLVEVLSRNLYSGPRVFIRELLQNAVDAITARAEAQPGLDRRVRVIADGGALTVVDNGIGITGESAGRLLARVGASSKRDEIGLARTDRMGQFGIGLLSCFMVADEIVVHSQAAAGTAAIEWIGSSNGTWTVRELDAAVPELSGCGTVVRLRMRPGERWAAPEVVEQLLREYGRYLPVTVTLEAPHTTVISEGTPPWDQHAAAQSRWCAAHFGFDPLAVIPLLCRAAGVRGAGFVLPAGAHPGRVPAHRVHLRRMLLGEQVTGLLPDWAYFVRVVIDTEHLRPTASREALVDDDLLAQTREELGAQIRQWLHRLAREQPQSFAAFLAAHRTGLQAMAISDAATRTLVADTVPWETTLGPATLTALAEQDGLIRYTSDASGFRTLAALAQANGLRVVNAGHAFEAALLDQFAADRPEVSVREISFSEILGALEPVRAGEEASFAALLGAGRTALEAADVDVVLRRFRPAGLAAVYLDGTAQFTDRLAHDIETGVEDAFTGLIDAMRPPAAQTPRAQLILNADAPLIHRLAGITDARLLIPALRGLYVQALLAGQHPLSPQARAWATGAFESLITRALGEP